MSTPISISDRSLLARYSVAIAATLTVTLLRWLLHPVLGHEHPVVLFTLAITLAASWGGLGPGLLATVLSIGISIWAFIQPIYSFRITDPAQITSLVILAVTGLGVSIMCGLLHRSVLKFRQPVVAQPQPEPELKPQSDKSDKSDALPFIDVHAVLTEAIKAQRPDAEAKRIRLTVDLDAKNRQVAGDATSLQQVFGSVLGNAVKFTPEAGAVFVQTRNTAEMLVIEIADTGIGLTEKEIDGLHLSQDGSAVDQGRRVGGLADAKAVLTAHKGRIAVSSIGRDRGTIFTIELPLPPAL